MGSLPLQLFIKIYKIDRINILEEMIFHFCSQRGKNAVGIIQPKGEALSQ
ncbi:hypothetical protein [Agrobacterium vitis]|nr:hypothetical protein [Agrobacterium vitis]MCM2453021.1 hypothetical protein [Agrobacterium vitis]